MADQVEIHRNVMSSEVEERRKAVWQLRDDFAVLPEQAGEDLHHLTHDEDCVVRQHAASVLVSNFSQIPDKEQAWNDLIRLIRDETWLDGKLFLREPIEGALSCAFQHTPDKEQAWNDLFRLTRHGDIKVRKEVVYALGLAFRHAPDKEQAWNDLIRLVQDGDIEVQRSAVFALGHAFQHTPDKEPAWNDLFRLTRHGDIDVREYAAFVLSHAFQHTPNKEQAWSDLHRLIKGGDVCFYVADGFGAAFPHIHDKKQAWKDLHRLTKDKRNGVREKAVAALGVAFPHIPDKKQAWKDLHRLTQDEENDVREKAVAALGVAFPQIPDKKQAWKDLHRLTQDEENDVRRGVAHILGVVFQHVPDKKQAWNDLIRLIKDEGDYLRGRVADDFQRIFDDKQIDTLHIMNGEVYYVRRGAVYALGAAFQYIPDKEQAWEDLHRLTTDKDEYMRWSSAYTLGVAFPHIPDKEQAWEDLHRLTTDKDGYVREFANHSLGRASIFKATETENEKDFRKELKKAIGFFEIMSPEKCICGSPSLFCHPFYESFYKITFEGGEAKDKVRADIMMAKLQLQFRESRRLICRSDKEKIELVGSKNEEMLLEAVENLTDAMAEVQKAHETDFNTVKLDFNAYRRYCDRAAGLISGVEEAAPGATRVLQRGLPIINDKIKETIREIQGNTRAICKETRGTILEDLGIELNRQGDNLSKTQNPIELDKKIDIHISILLKMFAQIPDGKTDLAYEMLKKAKNEQFIENRIDLMSIALASMLPCIGDAKMSIKIGKIENSPGVQIGGVNVQQIGAASDPPTTKPDKHKFTLREIVYGAIIDIAIHVLVIISIDHYLDSSMDKIAPYLIITFVIVLIITVFALHKLQNAKSS